MVYIVVKESYHRYSPTFYILGVFDSLSKAKKCKISWGTSHVYKIYKGKLNSENFKEI